jgi:hypothetical protein
MAAYVILISLDAVSADFIAGRARTPDDGLIIKAMKRIKFGRFYRVQCGNSATRGHAKAEYPQPSPFAFSTRERWNPYKHLNRRSIVRI